MAASTVSIWKNVEALPSHVGDGWIVPPDMWISTAPSISTRSRLMTTAVIQNGMTLRYVSVMKEAVRRSLSAIGSRNAPRRVWSPRRGGEEAARGGGGAGRRE